MKKLYLAFLSLCIASSVMAQQKDFDALFQDCRYASILLDHAESEDYMPPLLYVTYNDLDSKILSSCENVQYEYRRYIQSFGEFSLSESAIERTCFIDENKVCLGAITANIAKPTRLHYSGYLGTECVYALNSGTSQYGKYDSEGSLITPMIHLDADSKGSITGFSYGRKIKIVYKADKLSFDIMSGSTVIMQAAYKNGDPVSLKHRDKLYHFEVKERTDDGVWTVVDVYRDDPAVDKYLLYQIRRTFN